jgi:hypothetical protein
MNHPSNDLAWCAFVIENDYLQISNSISCSSTSLSQANLSKQMSYEGESDAKKEKPLKVKGRRFSKTISLNFGERN